MPSHDPNVATKRKLLLRVNDELALDAGTCEDVEGAEGKELRIRPPKTTLFHQVLAYLEAKPDPPKRPARSIAAREGLAAAALILRWGSYLSVLLDPEKPLWREVRSPRTSRIHDAEMARINIEASAALAEWIDLSRADRQLYEQLLHRALRYLPMPLLRPSRQFRLRMKREIEPFLALANPTPASERELISAGSPEFLMRVQANAKAHPSRLFANTLLNIAWRNGPVESMHAGKSRGYLLDERRITREEEESLTAFSSERLGLGMELVEQLAQHRTGLSWPDQVLAFGLAQFAPRNWTLTERSRAIHLS